MRKIKKIKKINQKTSEENKLINMIGILQIVACVLYLKDSFKYFSTVNFIFFMTVSEEWNLRSRYQLDVC